MTHFDKQIVYNADESHFIEGGFFMYTIKSQSNVCSIVGMPAYRLDTDLPDLLRQEIGKYIEREIRHAIQEGYTIFRVGMDLGADIWAAEFVAALRDRHFPHIQLHCHLPCETQANNWPEPWRELYFNTLATADEVYYLKRRFTRGCMARRMQKMIAGSAKLIAVHDNLAEGSVAHAIAYAEWLGIEAEVIRPFEGPDAPAAVREALRRTPCNQINDQIRSTYSVGFSTSMSAIRRAW